MLCSRARERASSRGDCALHGERKSEREGERERERDDRI